MVDFGNWTRGDLEKSPMRARMFLEVLRKALKIELSVFLFEENFKFNFEALLYSFGKIIIDLL